jgi:hypothetical protein
MPDLTEDDLVVGATYRAKSPVRTGTIFCPMWNDRTILWIGIGEVQYDGPAVKFGRKYPRVKTEAFLRWAGRKMAEEETSHAPT